MTPQQIIHCSLYSTCGNGAYEVVVVVAVVCADVEHYVDVQNVEKQITFAFMLSMLLKRMYVQYIY